MTSAQQASTGPVVPANDSERGVRVVTHRHTKDYFTKEFKAAYDEFVALRSILLMRFPFWGVCAMNLTYVEAHFVSTLATDGFHFYCNPVFFMKKLSPGERLRGVAHEVDHAISNHVMKLIGDNIVDRRGNRDPEFWNIAVDHRVNLDLEECQIGDPFTSIQVYQDPKYKDMMPEEIYEDIAKNPPPPNSPNKQFDEHMEVDFGGDQDAGDQGDQDQPGDDGDQDGGDDGDQGQQPGNKPGGNQPGKAQDGSQPGPGGQQPGQGQGGTGGPEMKRITPGDFKEMVEGWKAAVVRGAAAQYKAEQEGKAAGTMPNSIRILIEKMKEPVFDWKDQLREFLDERMGDDYSYDMPDLAPFQLGFTIEGIGAPEDTLTDAFLWVDVSGSTLSVLPEFLSEFKGILEAYSSFSVKAGVFDTEVKEETVRDFDESNLHEFDDWMHNLSGLGGTVFGVMYDYMKERGIRPKLNIVFTDGEPAYNHWGDEDYCQTIFVVVNDRKKTAPFGVTLHYESARKLAA